MAGNTQDWLERWLTRRFSSPTAALDDLLYTLVAKALEEGNHARRKDARAAHARWVKLWHHTNGISRNVPATRPAGAKRGRPA